jgi:hypothetical protein
MVLTAVVIDDKVLLLCFRLILLANIKRSIALQAVLIACLLN